MDDYWRKIFRRLGKNVNVPLANSPGTNCEAATDLLNGDSLWRLKAPRTVGPTLKRRTAIFLHNHPQSMEAPLRAEPVCRSGRRPPSQVEREACDEPTGCGGKSASLRARNSRFPKSYPVMETGSSTNSQFR